jgi:catechol 2,3-dioxygenase-like lactoylglutathione lyase family enzyme
MKASINHLTILSENNYALGRYYEAFFHLRSTGVSAASDDICIGDGRVGLNIKPRVAGYRAHLDHFGIEVDDFDLALSRIREGYPKIECLERSSGLVSIHDPDGNVFLLSKGGERDREGFYETDGRSQDRVIDHFALRVLHPKQVTEFYIKVFELKPLDVPSGGDNVYLTDGNVTLVIIPWRIGDFTETGISARGMDHIGFRVESIDALKSDITRITEKNYRFQPSQTVVGRGKEGKGRLDMFRKACPLGCHHLADADGLLLDVRE